MCWMGGQCSACAVPLMWTQGAFATHLQRGWAPKLTHVSSARAQPISSPVQPQRALGVCKYHFCLDFAQIIQSFQHNMLETWLQWSREGQAVQAASALSCENISAATVRWA